MPLPLICSCGARFAVDESHADNEVVCPECQSVLRAPSAADPVPRVSRLALLSFILALIGAFTVVGTVLAVAIGLMAVVRILWDRSARAGLPFALAGVILGSGLTALTLLALTSDDLRHLGDAYREALVADQLDRTADPVIRRPDRGFRLNRPAAWGVARRGRMDDALVETLRVRRTPEVLLVWPGRSLYVDVRRDSISAQIPLRQIEQAYVNRLRDLHQEENEWDRQRRDQMMAGGGWIDWVPQDAEEAVDPGQRLPPIQAVSEGTPRNVDVLNETERVVPGAVGQEIAIHCRLDNRPWRLIVRFYRVGGLVHIVRAYGPTRHVMANEAELRQVLDSFRIVP